MNFYWSLMIASAQSAQVLGFVMPSAKHVFSYLLDMFGATGYLSLHRGYLKFEDSSAGNFANALGPQFDMADLGPCL